MKEAVPDTFFPVYRTAQERIASQLRLAILSGQLPRGTRLTQEELAKKTQTSTSPVREAVRQLAAEGLLRIDPHTQVMVAECTAEEAAEIYELLMIIEPMALKKAVGRISVKDKETAEKLLRQMYSEQDVGNWTLLNCEFHDCLVAASGAVHLKEVIKKLRGVGALYVSASLRSSEKRLAESNEEHRDILQVLCEGDSDRVVELSQSHLLSTLKLCQASLQWEKRVK